MNFEEEIMKIFNWLVFRLKILAICFGMFGMLQSCSKDESDVEEAIDESSEEMEDSASDAVDDVTDDAEDAIDEATAEEDDEDGEYEDDEEESADDSDSTEAALQEAMNQADQAEAGLADATDVGESAAEEMGQAMDAGDDETGPGEIEPAMADSAPSDIGMDSSAPIETAEGTVVRFVRSSMANLRSSPDKSASVVGSVSKGAVVLVSYEGDWAKLPNGTYIWGGEITGKAVGRKRSSNPWRSQQ